MWQVTLKLMRNSLKMLIPAGIAIVIGTAFIASTFLFGNALDASFRSMASAGFGGANYVASYSSNGSNSASDDSASDGATASAKLGDLKLDAIRKVNGVNGVRPELSTSVNLTNGQKHSGTVASPVYQPESLMVQKLTEGSWPANDGQITLSKPIADRLGAGIGDTIDVASNSPSPAPGRTNQTVRLTIVGFADDDYNAYYGGSAVVSEATFNTLQVNYPSADQISVYALYLDIAAPAGSVDQDVLDQVNALLPKGYEAISKTQYEDQSLNDMGADDGTSVITQFLLVFGILALLVAALVIANTFQVMVAQRRRTLALLRTIGAKKGQLYVSVIFEAAMLGLVSSLIGIAVAVGLVGAMSAGGIALAGIRFTLSVTWPVIVVPMAFGVAMTILASLSSARTATSVTPLEALQPLEISQEKKSGAARLVLSLMMMAIGVVVAAFAVWQAWRYLHGRSSIMSAQFSMVLLASIGAAGLFFVGLLLSAVRWMPALLKGVGALVSHCGPSATIAAANIQKNRRRVAATGAALLIGVTLVSCLGTGAACAKLSLARALDMRYSVDMQISGGSGAVIDQALLDKVKAVSGVEDARFVRVLDAGYGSDPKADGTRTMSLYGISAADAKAVMNADYTADVIADGTVVLPEKHLSPDMDITDGMDLKVLPFSLSSDGSMTDADHASALKVTISDFRRVGANYQLFGLVSPGTFDKLQESLAKGVSLMDSDSAAGSAGVAGTAGTASLAGTAGSSGGVRYQIWAKVDPNAVPVDLLNAVQDAVSDDPNVNVAGAFAERAVWDRNVNMVLMVMVGLLAVAVLIALIGVANTLSLSVIERTRESATLRAIGMTRGQLRRSLAVEALLISLGSGVVGVIVGNLFAWLGSYVMFSQFDQVRLTVDWGMTGIILAVAAVSALLASVFPARRAVRTPPVEALAEA
ncbi:ABC transporter permease [Bifidobacterium vespertilionis]|uniref:FtsX-like permease family protein n=1 Tax=Bifidobacterium vespertilionis TaxID=2562524 RepID=A0A5J5E7A6_9BIFI|nr:FtsX-like permease family protein [Bifidobacterium vespertilionis]KAA8821723.1 FtsX-like permease family protein [Bifidobacterium vespertilionis]KAA8824803.1 FtsX-like permease family protein [Bifidobacterium vespertilionis]